MSLEERIKKQDLLSRIKSPLEAVKGVEGGMTVATTGNALSGFPKALLLALAESMGGKKGKIRLFCAGALSAEVEEAFVKYDVISSRMGSLGAGAARKAVNEGRMSFYDVKSGSFPQQVERGDYGAVDVALIEAAAITAEGHIVPTTAVIDGPRWVRLAKSVVVEINPSVPVEIEGIHDIYLPDLPPRREAIPIRHLQDRIGTPFIPVEGDKITAIVESAPSQKAVPNPELDPESLRIAHHLIEFLKEEVRRRKLPDPLPPLELGIGNIASAIGRGLRDWPFRPLDLYLPGITSSVLDLIDQGKVHFAVATNFRMEASALERFFAGLEHYRKYMLLRPLDVINSAEIIQRLGVITLNGAIEADLLGQVNSSHLMGTDIMGGIGGSYDYARNARLSVFLTPSTSRGGAISCLVPHVTHVDHTEHEVDVLCTEQGLADLRGLEPWKRAERIIQACAHPDYKGELRAYLEEARAKVRGRQPFLMEGAFKFHERFRKNKTMKEDLP